MPVAAKFGATVTVVVAIVAGALISLHPSLAAIAILYAGTKLHRV